MEYIFFIIGFLILLSLFWLYEKWSAKRRFDNAFRGRKSLSTEAFYAEYFKSQNIPKYIVYGVKQILEEQLNADLSKLSAEDDFSKNLSFFWEFDSLADVEIIIALEEKFNIKIRDSEAEKTYTVRDRVHLVWVKLEKQA